MNRSRLTGRRARTAMLPLAGAVALLLAASSAVQAAPSITSVTAPGCTTSGSGVTDCPTAGSIPITIIGTNFGASAGLASVGGTDCTSSVWTNAMVVCSLPAGSGRSRPVVIADSGGVYSPPAFLVDYANPSISSVTGCTGGNTNCDRSGGVLLTINGTNFGSLTGRSVTVGSSSCPVAPGGLDHTVAVCTLPSGTGSSHPVVVTSAGGSSSANSSAATVSYAACPAGTFVAGLACSNCPRGFYQDAPDQPFCQPCEAGTFASSLASTTCYNCAGGYSSSAGASTCTACDAGQYSELATGSAACRDCPPGQAGTVPPTDECVSCPAGTYADGVTCTPCMPGRYAATTNSIQCQLCPPGSFASGGSATSCTPCPAGTFTSGAGATTCEACGPDTFAPEGDGTCRACPDGYIGTSAPSDQCEPCPAGKYELAGACMDCPPGTFQSATGQASCLPCPAGSVSASSGASSCTACGVGYAQPAAAQTSCSPCAPGSVAAGTGSTECTPCAAGTYQANPASGSCESCAAGTFQGAQGQTGCSACASDATSQPGSTACVSRETMMCWKAKDVNKAFVATADVPADDAFSTGTTVDVRKVRFVCSAADVASGGIDDPSAYQCCYSVAGDKLAAPELYDTSDSLGGNLTLEIAKRDLVCEPCAVTPHP